MNNIKAQNDRWRSTAEKVASYYTDVFDQTALCYLDHTTAEIWERNALYVPLRTYIGDLRRRISAHPEVSRLISGYDHLVYVPQTLCEPQELLAITLAHELRHLHQFRYHRAIWELNMELRDQLEVPDWQLPHERDAYFASIDVAKKMLGNEQITKFLDRRSQNPEVTPHERKVWMCILELSRAGGYDLENETRALENAHNTRQ